MQPAAIGTNTSGAILFVQKPITNAHANRSVTMGLTIDQLNLLITLLYQSYLEVNLY